MSDEIDKILKDIPKDIELQVETMQKLNDINSKIMGEFEALFAGKTTEELKKESARALELSREFMEAQHKAMLAHKATYWEGTFLEWPIWLFLLISFCIFAAIEIIFF